MSVVNWKEIQHINNKASFAPKIGFSKEDITSRLPNFTDVRIVNCVWMLGSHFYGHSCFQSTAFELFEENLQFYLKAQQLTCDNREFGKSYDCSVLRLLRVCVHALFRRHCSWRQNSEGSELLLYAWRIKLSWLKFTIYSGSCYY